MVVGLEFTRPPLPTLNQHVLDRVPVLVLARGVQISEVVLQPLAAGALRRVPLQAQVDHVQDGFNRVSLSNIVGLGIVPRSFSLTLAA